MGITDSVRRTVFRNSTMKVFAVVCLIFAVANAQSPAEIRRDVINYMWDVYSNNGCLTRLASRGFFQMMDKLGDSNNAVTKDEFAAFNSPFFGDDFTECAYPRLSAVGGNPIAIPDGTDRIFDAYGTMANDKDCMPEQSFKSAWHKALEECKWPSA